MKIFITDEQKAELEHLHHTCRDKRECDRIKAVLLASEGWSSMMIAQALRLHETTVNRHISDDLNHRKLKPENGGSQSYLSETQAQELIAYLTSALLPTTQAVIRLVEEWWDISYTVQMAAPQWLQLQKTDRRAAQVQRGTATGLHGNLRETETGSRRQ